MKVSSKRVYKHRLKKKVLKKIHLSKTENSEDSDQEFDLDQIINSESEKNETSSVVNYNCQEECNSERENYPSESYSDDTVDQNTDSQISDNSTQWQYEQEISDGSDGDTSEESMCDVGINEAEEVQDLRRWAVKTRIPRVHLDSLLKILNKRPLLNVPSSHKTFLKTTAARYTIESIKDSKDSPAEFVYLGIEKKLLMCVNPKLHSENILQLDFNIDGVKLRKSSSKQLWPILCRVFYEPNCSVYKPFSVALYYGNGKPKSSLEYFHKFISELNKLLQDGIYIQSERFSISIRTFICDTPARAFIKCIKGHTSLNGCERCDTVAERHENTTTYLSLGRKRTNEDFKTFSDTHHHIDVSPLIGIQIEIDFIKQFVLDSMHLLYLGITLRLLEQWMTGNLNVRIGASQKSELSRRIKMIQTDIPKEFQRKIRPIDEYDKYKAVEHRFFTLYCGPIVLKKILKEDMYQHFLQFHTACRMLSSKEAQKYVTLSKYYLKNFVIKSAEIYGLKFVSLNVHNLHHVADDVENLKSNLNNSSAFPFESELGKIKNILLSPHRTLAQYCRRTHEENEILDQLAKVPHDVEIIKQHIEKGILQLKYKNQYFSNKHPDNTALLNNRDVIKIQKMFLKEENIYIKVSKYRIKKSVYDYPCDSSFLDIFEVEEPYNNNDFRNIPLHQIKSKLVKLCINFGAGERKRIFVIPLLH